ncbi:MAG: LysE family transporter [Candidatus Hydrogenedentes bacterium]|nr:LysE family transporter [Candidatus Hydrogenedentota bacterium]
MKVETWLFLFKGIAIGLSISAPVGPMGLLCIRRTLAAGRACGIVSGLGVATADGFYSSVAALGLAAVSNLLLSWRLPLRLAGGIVLCVLGTRIFFERAAAEREKEEPGATRLLTAYSSMLVLALSNPVGIIFFTAVFAGWGLADTGGDYGGALLLVCGVFLGSLLWWITLSTTVHFLGTRLSPTILRRVNQVSGLLIAVFGILVLAHLQT